MYSSFYQTHKLNHSQLQPSKMQVLIIGKNSDPELEFIVQQSDLWINNDIDSNEDMLCFNDCVEIEIVTMHQTHFEYILKELKRKSPEMLSHSANAPIILINSIRYIPNFVRLIATFILEIGLPKEIFIRSLPYTFDQQNDYLLQLTQMTHSKLLQYFNFSETYTYVFFDIKLKSGFLECKRKTKSMSTLRMNTPSAQKINQFRIIIQLNSRIMPKTSFNFYQLCQGNFKNQKGQRLTYKNSSFHALQKNAYIQGGAFSEHEKDESVFGPTFEDESYAIKHDQPGIVGMANQGMPHTNASQFYISLGSQPDKDHKYVAFGLVVFGMKYLRKLNKLSEKSSFSPPFETRIVNCGEYNFQKNDFVQETKKDFDLLDNGDIINTQLALATRQRQERSQSTSNVIRTRIYDGNITKVQIKKDKDPFATSKERFKSTLPKQKEKKKIKYPNQVQLQQQAAQHNKMILENVQKEQDRIKELIKPENKEIFKQYKKELNDQPIFQFQNFNLLAERGGNGKNNKKLQEQTLQQHQGNTYGNQLVKFKVNNYGMKSNFGSFQIIPESNNNLDNKYLQSLTPLSTQDNLNNKRNNQAAGFNTDQYLLKLLNLPNISSNKSNQFITQSPKLPNPQKETFRTDLQSNNFINLSDKDFFLNGVEFGSRPGLNKIKKQNTPQSQTLLELLNNNFSLGNGQALQFRRPVVERNTASSFNKNKFGSINSIRNAIKNQSTFKQQTTNQQNILDEVSQKIISTSKEDLGSLIIISQISQFKRFIAVQYHKKLQDEQMVELNNIIPGLSESIAMQLPISLKKSLSFTQEQIFLNKQLTQDIQIPHTDTRNTLIFMSKQVGFDISEVDDDW